MQEATRNRFQEINNKVQEARDQAAKEAKEAQQDLKKRRDAAIIAVLVVLIVGLIGMAVVPYFRDDPSRGVAIKETLKLWVDVALTIKNILVVIVGVGYLSLAVGHFSIEVLDIYLGSSTAVFIAVGIVLNYFPKKIKKALCESIVIVCGLFWTLFAFAFAHASN
jgi:cation transport ATPase